MAETTCRNGYLKHLLVTCTMGAVLLSATGCATRTGNIQAAYIAPMVYPRWKCEQLRAKAERSSIRASRLSGAQSWQASADAVASSAAAIMFCLMPQGAVRAPAPPRPRPAAPERIVAACRDKIVEAARPYGAVSVDARTAGQPKLVKGGKVAPLQVKIVFARKGGREVKQATINCTIGAGGKITLS
jgi:hypothetical protein